MELNLAPMRICRGGHRVPVVIERCPRCTKISMRAWKLKHVEQTAAYNKEYNKQERVRSYRRDISKKYRNESESARVLHVERETERLKDDRYRFVRILKNYGLEVIDFANLLVAQKFKCPGCAEELKLNRRTHVDHCHDTGKVRGILCHHCNLALGQARNSATTLRNLAVYLDKEAEAVHDADGKLIPWQPEAA